MEAPLLQKDAGVPVTSSSAQQKMITGETNSMNTLTKWNPLREFELMRNRMNTLFPGALPPRTFEEPFGTSEWSPLVDVEETDKEYLIKAELPEVRKEDVKVELENGSIRIAGERKQEKETEGHRFLRVERNYGAFERIFAMPEGAEKKGISSEFRDGILKIHLPKSPGTEHRTMEIPVH